MDVGGFWRSPKKWLLRTHLAIFILFWTGNRCKEKTQPKHLLPCHTIMQHKSRFLESVRWTSSTAGIAVSGFRTGWSDFGRDLCIVMIVMWSHQTKTSFFSYWTTIWLDWRFDLRFCLRYGEFSFFFFLGQRSPRHKTDVLEDSKWTTPRNDPDGPGLWLEPGDAVSILRNPHRVFRFGEGFPPDFDIKQVENVDLTVNQAENFREVEILRSQRHRKSQKIHGGQRGRHLSR